MRILIALALVVAGCSKKKEDAPPPKTEAPKSTEMKPTAPDTDEKPTPTEPAVQPAAGEPRGAGVQPPTIDMAEKRLREMLAALEEKDYKKAMTFMASSP